MSRSKLFGHIHANLIYIRLIDTWVNGHCGFTSYRVVNMKFLA